jgi:Uma2 family endonuclease
MTALERPPTRRAEPPQQEPPPAPDRIALGDQRLTLDGVSLKDYVAIGEIFRDRPVYMTFDRGRLEIMTKGLHHEGTSRLLLMLLTTALQVGRVPFRLGGSTTFRREELEKGLEPHECLWIAGERALRGVREWDPAAHPPPDLAVEIDFTSSSVDRMGIYAALGVAEVWRFDGRTLTVEGLEGGAYRMVERSRWLPQLPPAEVLRFLHAYGSTDDGTWLEEFRDWAKGLPPDAGNRKD